MVATSLAVLLRDEVDTVDTVLSKNCQALTRPSPLPATG